MKILQLSSLKTKRERSDRIMTLNILNRISDLNKDTLFKDVLEGTIGHGENANTHTHTKIRPFRCRHITHVESTALNIYCTAAPAAAAVTTTSPAPTASSTASPKDKKVPRENLSRKFPEKIYQTFWSEGHMLSYPSEFIFIASLFIKSKHQ